MGNKWQFDPCIFLAFHGSIQVEVFNIKAIKPCPWTWQDTVYYQLYKFQIPCRCCNIPRVADTSSFHSDTCTVGVVLVRSYLTHHTGVTYLLTKVLRNVIKFNEPKGACSLNTLILRPTCAATNTLENPPKFIGIGYVLHIFIIGWLQSWQYSSYSPVSLSNIGISVCSSVIGLHHKLMSSVGYFRCAVNTGWTLKACWVVRDLVWWATGWYVAALGSNCLGADWERSRWSIGWWLDGISPVEMGCTRGGDCCPRRCTLGSGSITGVDFGTLGDRWLRVDSIWRGRSVVAISTTVSPAQCSRVSGRSLLSWSFASTVNDGISLRTAVSCCTPCSTFPSSVTYGRVILWYLISMVSDTISALVSLDTTLWQR